MAVFKRLVAPVIAATAAVAAAASLAMTAPASAATHGPASFIGHFSKIKNIASTVPANGTSTRTGWR
jgi:hypothetical protein